MVDIGLGALIAKMEQYCGVFVTKWLIRLLTLAVTIGIFNYIAIWAFDIRLHQIVKEIFSLELSGDVNSFLIYLVKLAGGFVIIILAILAGDKLSSIFTKITIEHALDEMNEAKRQKQEAEELMKTAEARLAAAEEQSMSETKKQKIEFRRTIEEAYLKLRNVCEPDTLNPAKPGNPTFMKADARDFINPMQPFLEPLGFDPPPKQCTTDDGSLQEWFEYLGNLRASEKWIDLMH